MLSIRQLVSIAHDVPITLTIVALSILFAMVGILFASKLPSQVDQGPLSLGLSPRQQRCRWKHDAMGMVQEVYRKFPGKVFQVYSPDGPQVFIPPNLMDEIKAFPDNVLSIADGVRELFQTEHTLFPDPGNQEWITWTKQNLGKNVAKYAEIARIELERLLQWQFKQYEGWQPIQVHPSLVKIISVITSRILVGPALFQDDKWLFTTIIYPRDVFIAITFLKFWPRWLRSLAKYFIPHMWVSWQRIETAERVVKEALQHPGDGDSVHGVYDVLSEDKKNDYAFQGRAQLGLAFAALHNTVRVICQVLFDIAEHPEYVPMLRAEMMSVLGKGSHIDLLSKNWTVENLALLKKLDSVMKESMRLHGGGVTSFRRKVLKPITLSDGTYLPPGTFVNAATHALSHDATIFPDPEKFEGLRFYKMRQRSQADKNRHQFTTIDNAATYFGAGRHACPGRTFAGVLAKMILASLVMKYDFKMIEGDSTPRDHQSFGGLVSVNTMKLMMIRDRVEGQH